MCLLLKHTTLWFFWTMVCPLWDLYHHPLMQPSRSSHKSLPNSLIQTWYFFPFCSHRILCKLLLQCLLYSYYGSSQIDCEHLQNMTQNIFVTISIEPRTALGQCFSNLNYLRIPWGSFLKLWFPDPMLTDYIIICGDEFQEISIFKIL